MSSKSSTSKSQSISLSIRNQRFCKSKQTRLKKIPQLTEVGEFQLADLADEQILRLEIAVEDLALVDVGEAAQQLEQEEAHVVRQQAAWMALQVLCQVGMLHKKMDALNR